MRFIGLTLCLLASTFGARADSLEDRVTALELRVKVLEDALHAQGAPLTASNLDGNYKAVLPNGDAVTAVFDKGKVVASDGKETKTGTYTVVGEKVVVETDGKTETLSIEGNHLRTDDRDRLEFDKTGPANAVANIDGSYQAAMPGGKTLNLVLAAGKATLTMDQDTKNGPYELIGDHVVITIDGKPETLSVQGDHLTAQKGSDKIDFTKTK